MKERQSGVLMHVHLYKGNMELVHSENLLTILLIFST